MDLRSSPTRWIAPWLAAAALACSSAPPAPAGSPPPAASAAPTPAPPGPQAAASAPEPASAPATEPPGARVTEVSPSKESAPYARAKIEFKNPGPRPCLFASYTLSWGASSKEIKLDNFTIPPGESRERWLKVHPDDGDLKALSPESARVEVKTECGP